MLLAAAVIAATLPVIAPPVSPSAGAAAPAAVECTTPPPSFVADSLTPQALRERYGIQPLLDAGYDGRGQTAVLIEFDQSVDIEALDQWKACLGVDGPPITQTGVLGASVPLPPSPCGGTGEPGCFGEAQGDAYAMIAGAPGLDQLYVLVSDQNEQEVLADILDRVRSGVYTGGRRPDVVSLSFGDCQPQWTTAEIEDTETALQALAEAGTWFFHAAGDAGPSGCSNHPVCDTALAGPDMRYPAASRWTTAVGGTEIEDANPLGEGSVWNESPGDVTTSGGENCASGGGGLSTFPTPASQGNLPGGATLPTRGLPDVSALAGYPGYLNLASSGSCVNETPADCWFGNGGTSLASPLYAGAFASIRSRLLAEGLTPPTVLNDAIYAIAADPTDYAAAFVDITKGNNRIYESVDCCDATIGYDLASGLGELRIDVVAELLATVARNTVPTTPTTPTTTPAAAVPATPAFTG
ncbi:MAG: S8 family serine peptidase [Acidimicrobiales bacterium]|nr:S8 family serine peptidase [Acidimicrobiales bacterium]